MASNSMQMRPNIQLRELLQEEQEPFILDSYLVERVYSKNASRVELDKVLNKPASYHLQRRIKKGVLYPSKLLKSAYNKLVLINKSLRIKNCDGEVSHHEMNRINNEATGLEIFSSASSSTVYNSCPESDKEEEEASTSLHCQDHTWDNSKSCNQRKDDPGWFQVAELLEFVQSNASSQLVKFKLQNQQLLFDCVREIITENNGRREILGSKEIGELIFDNMKEWGEQCASIEELVSVDLEDEWSDLKAHKEEFAMAVGDDILEELRNQLVIDMLHPFI